MITTLKPTTEDELSSLVSSANRANKKLSIIGGGTRLIGNKIDFDETLTTSGIKGITLYEPGALTIVAKSGTPLAEINKALASENQGLPFEPGDYSGLFGTKGKSTIGGVVGAAVSGPRRIQTGACRDSLIGVRFVDGEGTIIKNGGRVMKNVTGYDLVKLMAGSYGTLGVLSEVSFKVLPRPEMTGVVLLHGLDDETASIAMAKALSSPFDISGAAHLSLGSNDIPLTMIRVEGFTGSIKYRTWKLKELLAGILPAKAEISIELDQTKAQDLWKLVRDVEPFHGSSSDVWRLSVKPGDGWKIVETLHKNMETKTLYDWGGGLVWLAAETNGDNAKSNAEAIRSAVNAVGGHATLIRSNAPHSEVDAFHPEHPRVAQISQQLRQQFDPKSILNPGRMAHVQQSRSMVGA